MFPPAGEGGFGGAGLAFYRPPPGGLACHASVSLR
jgi:hypothetical protein